MFLFHMVRSSIQLQAEVLVAIFTATAKIRRYLVVVTER